MNKRLKDQILVLEAIGNVRKELKWGMPMKDASEVTMRLVTLYSLLNVEQLKRVAELIDDRKEDKKEGRMKRNKFGISQQDLDLMQSFEDLIARKEYVEDFIDTFSPDELAQMVREGIITLPEIEVALRRKVA